MSPKEKVCKFEKIFSTSWSFPDWQLVGIAQFLFCAELIAPILHFLGGLDLACKESIAFVLVGSISDLNGLLLIWGEV
ncbi:unnamed protein product [Linum trigynum]|uniref:Uncharacterized protein n=1 Tax=Linum trigynum TaxID=586398 RepID=A0AAV2FW53_9ROSI